MKNAKINMIHSILGENNAGGPHGRYNCTFSKLIEHWRSIWHARTNAMTDPLFHFGFVQVSSI
jgi:hypothetical protein